MFNLRLACGHTVRVGHWERWDKYLFGAYGYKCVRCIMEAKGATRKEEG